MFDLALECGTVYASYIQLGEIRMTLFKNPLINGYKWDIRTYPRLLSGNGAPPVVTLPLATRFAKRASCYAMSTWWSEYKSASEYAMVKFDVIRLAINVSKAIIKHPYQLMVYTTYGKFGDGFLLLSQDSSFPSDIQP